MSEKFKRVLLKVSGEALRSESGKAIFEPELLDELAEAVKTLVNEGIQACIVVGAGNIWRGNRAHLLGMDGADADDMGMLGTIINALAIQAVLKKHGLKAKAFSSVPCPKFIDYYTKRDALEALQEGCVCVFGGGTSNPFFTTDSAAALRALEVGCDAILMAKAGVEGVFTADPRKDPTAKLIRQTTYKEILDRGIKVMDATAAGLLLDSDIVTRVFEMVPSNFVAVAEGSDIGTTVKKSW